ncbi:MAG: nuclear transport factor 2 family protein [Bacteroidia bacterium]|nr:nuclear transport factor 2 family protein [Bacteroidia bacterium]
MKKKVILFLFGLAFFLKCYCQKISTKEWQNLDKVLQKQVSAWNQGDLDGFMEAYWKSDSLRFLGQNGITYGWQNTLQAYRRSYPDPETMGKLTLTVLHQEAISSNVVYMFGKWELKRTYKENLAGHFTLLWKKIKGKWQIVFDHSSSTSL